MWDATFRPPYAPSQVDVWGSMVELLAETREEAVSEMINAAQEMGANAIVAVRMATSQVMSDAAEVLSYGTAVRLE